MVDAATFTEEATALLRTLYRVSLSILRADADAQDAVQQALMKAWAAKDRAQPDRFRPWLTRIVINESRNIQRRRMRVMPVADIPHQPDVALPDIDVVQAIEDLPEKWRIPFLLKYAGRYTEQEIAGALRLPASTVKSRLYSARQALKQALSDREVMFE